MCSRELLCLSLLILLWCCQANEQTVKTSKDTEDGFDETSIDYSSPFGRKLRFAEASSPTISDREPDEMIEFMNLLGIEIDLCISLENESTCRWRRGLAITDTAITHTVQISLSTCCCACRNADVCDAVHYESSGGGQCVFHRGGRMTDERARGARRWIK